MSILKTLIGKVFLTGVILLLAVIAGVNIFSYAYDPYIGFRNPIILAWCDLRNGTVIVSGGYPAEPKTRCSLPTEDVDKECTDSDQCDGRCLAKTQNSLLAPGTKGSSAVGLCSDMTIPEGNPTYVEDGYLTKPID